MLEDSSSPKIRLTRRHGEKRPDANLVEVGAYRLLTYKQEKGFTRLRVIGGECLEVLESAGEIDQLVRQATNPLQSQAFRKTP